MHSDKTSDIVVGDNGKIVKSEKSFFADEQEVLQYVKIMTSDIEVNDSDETGQPQQEALRNFIKKLEKYQEQSQLLDPYLEVIITPLMEQVRAIMRSREEESNARANENDDGSFPFQMYKNPQLDFLFQAMYTLCRIRGYKTVIKFLPHEVADLEPTLSLLQSQDAQDHETWQTRYMLLLWMSILTMIPFDLTSVDSTIGGSTTTLSLIENTTSICKTYLNDAGPTREAAAICIARLLTRPDMDSVHLGQFLEWSTAKLEDFAESKSSTENTLSASKSIAPPSIFLVTGIYNALAEIFKRGHREQLISHIPAIFSRVVRLTTRSGHISSLERKLTIKLVQRIGKNFLPPKVVSWRYQRGHRSLLANFNNTNSTQSTNTKQEENEDEDDIEIPEEMEDVIEQLLCGLRDKDTIVRWSAAKGIGRVTGRLPKELGDDVVAFVLELFDAAEGDSAWHGGCLALAELARRGLLLPVRLDSVVPLVIKALVYDVRRGHNSVGAHVRDAACYVCWAFARAYAPSVMAPYVQDLSRQMLVTALFDREVNCRRAASAAFQENVGRQGHDNFPNGIEILTSADYFTLGIRANAYTVVAKTVAKFDLYRQPLIDHLVEVKLSHWDKNVRELSAQGLASMVSLDPEYFATTVLGKLFPRSLDTVLTVRHGAILGSAEIVLALSKVPFDLPKERLVEARNLIMKVEKARLYRGRGGESIRLACCRFIECIALSGHILSERAQLRLMESIDESIKHPKEEVQIAAVAALKAMAQNYFEADHVDGGADAQIWRPLWDRQLKPTDDAIVKRLVDKYATGVLKDDNAAVRRGYALALGALPAQIIAGCSETLMQVINSLLQAATYDPNQPPEFKDAEARRNACRAIKHVVASVGVKVNLPLSKASTKLKLQLCTLDQQMVGNILDTLFKATCDYEIDDRGDVGSLVRCEAMKSLTYILNFIRTFPMRIQLLHRLLQDLTTQSNAALFMNEEGEIFPRVQIGDHQGVLMRWTADRNIAWIRVDGKTTKVHKTKFSVLEPIFLTSMHEFVPIDLSTNDWLYEEMIPNKEERNKLSIDHASDKAANSISNLIPVQDAELGEFVQGTFDLYLANDIGTKAVGAFLKQMTDKLDLVRECAGACLLKLVMLQNISTCIELPIYHIQRLQNEFVQKENNHIDFKVAAEVFPRAVKFLSLKEYAPYLLSGISLSVGSITESVSKEANQSLVGWCKEQKAAEAYGNLNQIGMIMLDILEEGKSSDRVMVPALKTLSALLDNQLFDHIKDTESKWAMDVHKIVATQLKNTSNVAKLLAAGNVLLGLANFERPVRTAAFSSLLILLGYRFPKVRKAIAEDFYVWALAMDAQAICGPKLELKNEKLNRPIPNPKDEHLKKMIEMVQEKEAQKAKENCDVQSLLPFEVEIDPNVNADDMANEVLEVLMTTVWNESTANAREQRDRLYPLLHVKQPKRKSKPKSVEENSTPIEDDTYATLIHDIKMGY